MLSRTPNVNPSMELAKTATELRHSNKIAEKNSEWVIAEIALFLITPSGKSE